MARLLHRCPWLASRICSAVFGCVSRVGKNPWLYRPGHAREKLVAPGCQASIAEAAGTVGPWAPLGCPPTGNRHRDQKNCLRRRSPTFATHFPKLESAVRPSLRKTYASQDTRSRAFEDTYFLWWPIHDRAWHILGDCLIGTGIMNARTPNRVLVLWHTRGQMAVYDHRCGSPERL